MFVWVDVQGAQNPQGGERGVPRYIGDFARCLHRRYPELVSAWLLDSSLPLPPTLAPLLEGGKVHWAPRDYVPGPEVLHVLSPFEHLESGWALRERLWPRWARSGRSMLAVTVYDLIPLIFADHYLTDPTTSSRYRSRLELIKCADAVLAISAATARDVVRLLGVDPRRVHDVGTGIDPFFRGRPSAESVGTAVAAELADVRGGFILYVGGIDFRKNIGGLFAAYARLSIKERAAHQLVIVCRMTVAERALLTGTAESLGIAGDLLLTGLVADETLRALYAACELFVFPSLYEGFGLPVAEALACGARVIVGDNSSLQDLVPDDRSRFNAASPVAMAEAIGRALADPAIGREGPREDDDRHSWERVVDRTCDVYRGLLPRPRGALTWRRPRLAFLTPLPPAASGVADYSARLAPHLAGHFEVTIFAQPGHSSVPGTPSFDYNSFEWVEAAQRPFDAVLAAMGNSTFHFDIAEIVQERSSILLQHDVRMLGFHGAARVQRPHLVHPDDEAAVDAYNAGVLPPGLEDYRSLDPASYFRLNQMLMRRLARRAKAILVHSQTGANLVRLDVSEEDRDKVFVIPFGVPTANASPHRAGAAPLIVSMGIVAESKSCFSLTDAFILLAVRRPDLACAFVGEALDESTAQWIRDRSHSEGVSDRVLLTGRLPEDQYREWLERATIGVQLRAWSNGEASAAVTDLLAYGVPAIVSDVGWMAELPDEVVVKVDVLTPEELADAIEALLDDSARREALASAARQFSRDNDFAAAAKGIAERILAVISN